MKNKVSRVTAHSWQAKAIHHWRNLKFCFWPLPMALDLAYLFCSLLHSQPPSSLKRLSYCDYISTCFFVRRLEANSIADYWLEQSFRICLMPFFTTRSLIAPPISPYNLLTVMATSKPGAYTGLTQGAVNVWRRITISGSRMWAAVLFACFFLLPVNGSYILSSLFALRRNLLLADYVYTLPFPFIPPNCWTIFIF